MCELGLALWQPVTLPCPRGHRAHTSCEERAFGAANLQGCVASLAFAGIFISEAAGLLPSNPPASFHCPLTHCPGYTLGDVPLRDHLGSHHPSVLAWQVKSRQVVCLACQCPVCEPDTSFGNPIYCWAGQGSARGLGVGPLGMQDQDSGCRNTPKTPPLLVTAKVVGVKQG